LRHCDTVAQDLRRLGGEQYLAKALTWDQSARNLRGGKEAWVKLWPLVQTRNVSNAARVRYQDLKKKDPNTVSEQERLRTATDCDIVAEELRWEGGEQNLAYAATWDQAARNLRAGKEAWVKQIAEERAFDAAVARYNAFIKRDANTVSEQELAGAAKDAFTVSQYTGRQGGEQNLALAAKWEQAGLALSVGKEAYVKQIAAQAANSEMLQIMRAQDRARAQQRNAQALQNASTMNYVTSMNIIANMGGSGYHYEVRSR
jgi:hypothetical protein